MDDSPIGDLHGIITVTTNVIISHSSFNVTSFDSNSRQSEQIA